LPLPLAQGRDEMPLHKNICQSITTDSASNTHATLSQCAFAVYQGIIATDPGADGGGEKAPRPNKPADRGPGSALRARMDTRRVMYARYEQQSSLIRCGLWVAR
jgi:hypothetical protein